MKLLITILLTLGVCHAEPLTGVDLKLVSDTTAIEPAKPFTVGLHIHHHKDYHTYWQNPGIVGIPTDIEWTLPPGFTAGPIQWPTPEIVDMAGHPAHGFHRDVLLMIQITPPSKIEARNKTLHAEISWMACAKTCHPGNTSLSLTLPTGKATPSDSRPLFTTAKEKLPTPLTNWSVKLLSPPNAPTIRLLLSSKANPATKLEHLYFFSSDGQVSSDRPQRLTQKATGKFILTLERSEYGPENPSHLPGILSTATPIARNGDKAARINPAYLDKKQPATP